MAILNDKKVVWFDTLHQIVIRKHSIILLQVSACLSVNAETKKATTDTIAEAADDTEVAEKESEGIDKDASEFEKFSFFSLGVGIETAYRFI